MKVIEYTNHGAPHEVCRCVETAEPGEPGPGEVVVAVEASAINPADLLIIEGRYPGPAELPARQGIEGAGRIEVVGDGVEDLAEGDRVMLLGRANWAETVRLPAEQAVKIPQALDVLEAAQMKANPPTAKFMLEDFVDLEPGDWVIQNAANSAVGRHVIRFAASRGIQTINVVQRPSLAPTLEAIGSDLVVVDGDDLGERVRAEIGNATVALTLDAAGGTPCRHLADCLTDAWW